ncbi:uncharacterized protein EI90DRAFT_3116022 [Cantharellus anzutake]|uniref:uncharacterized protein n=1 Tax=Cantharellus anzutake TaxID=1750568 RepID=UPI00190749CF|nr:uncharacterized protein EI90DRAFT_3116022 [Cantharellus anzutake]KAF8342121.1 hypothetical protein EI90DRAFT_3116022 [Cantharellus anzutake]
MDTEPERSTKALINSLQSRLLKPNDEEISRLGRSKIFALPEVISKKYVVEKELALLQQVSSAASKELDKLVILEKRLQNRQTGIGKLPDENLELIFALGVRTRESSLPVLVYASTCFRWREVAIGKPSLWGTLSRFFPEKLTQLFLDRSQQAPLAVTFGKHICLAANSLHHHRIQRLTLADRIPEFSVLTSLQEVSVRYPSSTDGLDALFHLLSDAPIRRLRFQSRSIPSFSTVNAINLTHVTLYAYHPSIPSAISAAVNLVYLLVQIDNPEDVVSPVTGFTALPYLRSLTLRGVSEHHGLFPQSADRLEYIQLDNSKPPPPVLHSSQFPCLRAAEIDSGNIDVSHLTDFFFHHSGLDCFCISGLDSAHNPLWLERLCVDPGSSSNIVINGSVLCPSLRLLQLEFQLSGMAYKWDHALACYLLRLPYVRDLQTSTPLRIELKGITIDTAPYTFQLARSKSESNIVLYEYLSDLPDPFEPDWL